MGIGKKAWDREDEASELVEEGRLSCIYFGHGPDSWGRGKWDGECHQCS